MSELQRTEQVSREAVLGLLSNDEVAKVSTAETAAVLTEGAEFLDLDHLDLGIQRFTSATAVKMGQILPRAAVHDDTWKKILARLIS